MTIKFNANGWIEQWVNRRKMRKVLRLLENSGVEFSTVYDIGANRGRWSRDMRRLLPHASFFLFEANDKHRSKLASRGFPFFICVLGAREETRPFYSIGGTGDSLYREKTSHYLEAEYREVKTRSLTSLAKDESLPAPNFIKLDVQGAELDILEGARDILESCHLIYMECPVMEYNLGAPRFDAYIQFMSDLGFVPLQALEQHLVDGALMQIDLLFLRRSGSEGKAAHG
jgi:FkbM family methyltransferase